MVRIEEGDVPPARRGDAGIPRDRRATIDGELKIANTRGEGRQRRIESRRIWRSVVDNDDFESAEGLREHRVERAGDVAGRATDGQDNGHLRGSFHN